MNISKHRLKNNKVVEPDLIHNEILKRFETEQLKMLTNNNAIQCMEHRIISLLRHGLEIFLNIIP